MSLFKKAYAKSKKKAQNIIDTSVEVKDEVKKAASTIADAAKYTKNLPWKRLPLEGWFYIILAAAIIMVMLLVVVPHIPSF